MWVFTNDNWHYAENKQVNTAAICKQALTGYEGMVQIAPVRQVCKACLRALGALAKSSPKQFGKAYIGDPNPIPRAEQNLPADVMKKRGVV